MGDYGMDAGQRLGCAGVNAQNARMGVRAAENGSTQLAWLNTVGQKARVAAELGCSVWPGVQRFQPQVADVMRGEKFHDGSGQQPAMPCNQSAGNLGQVRRQALLASGAYVGESGADL